MIDWIHFTPWASLMGGVLLGIAASLFILLNGRILGISGILGGFLPPKMGDIGWRVTFLLGMAMAPVVFSLLAPAGFIHAPRIDTGYGLISIAGLLVGLGTRYGSGCTSGHGICGLSGLSLRSLVATIAFMVAGFTIVFVIKHIV